MNKWYLIDSNTSPNMLGGFEDEPFVDFKQDAFMESLQTELASTVVLYNYDLSVSKKIRCIIQDNIASTQLKSIERTILFPIGTVKAGMYVFFENCYWLITGFPGNNKIYEKVTAILCQYKLRWQNEHGRIIERWCNTTSASKYDTGRSGGNIIMLTSDNLTLLLPDDDESLNLDSKRVFIDKRKDNPTKVYSITRTDGTLYDYGIHGGVIAFIADKTEFNPDTDNQKMRICDYVDPSIIRESKYKQKENKSITYKIKCTTPTIKVGGNYRTFKGVVIDTNNNQIDNIGKWIIDSTFNDKLITILSDNQIKIKISDQYEDLIGQNFTLSFCSLDNSISDSISIQIESYM